MPKTPLTTTDPKFDLKFLLVGGSGSGKTHLCGTYTQGPVHFYMIDPGGEKTLRKLLPGRPAISPITIEYFSLQDHHFTDIWKQLQADAKAGFFEELASQNGLLVLPDSLTTLSIMITRDIAKKHNRDLKSADKNKIMRIQDWGVLGAYLRELISVINDLPCAVAATAHLHNDTDSQGSIIGRAPLVSGNLKYTMGLFFDEVYLLENKGNNRNIHFKETNHFQAKTRTFTDKTVKNVTMDDIATAYLSGEQLKGGDKEKPVSKKSV